MKGGGMSDKYSASYDGAGGVYYSDDGGGKESGGVDTKLNAVLMEHVRERLAHSSIEPSDGEH